MEAEKIPFGESSGKSDVVLVCAHDGDGDEFLRRFPDVVDHLDPADRDGFPDYLALERDAGSFALSCAIAQKITALYRGTRVEIIKAQIPRGIKDPNRGGLLSEPRLFRNGMPNSIYQVLNDGHRSAVLQTHQALDPSRMHDHGLVIDVHTMASYSPKEYKTPRAGSLREYVRSWTDPNLRGEKRVTDIITSTPGGKMLGDHELATAVENRFEDSGIDSMRNYPYPAPDGSMTQEWFLSRPGIAIDVTKSELEERVHGRSTNPTRPNISARAVNIVAQPIARGIVDVLKQRRRV